eukprot:TRINITY_DN25003_c0_g1_i1.p1 TRINITY_DN25003_c0_g1~~TRINITY_DN25003_c0_g1_i1.p1  ORF type:complete len:339 (+),score=78.09 TRINITY_DN25003_c0_g1_i1:88-1104(+)
MSLDRKLRRLVEGGDYDGVVGYLGSHGLDRIDACDEGGQRCLHLAAGKGHVELVTLLLSNGAQPSAPDAQRSTPLHEACASAAAESRDRGSMGGAGGSRHRRVVEALLQHGANPHARDSQGRTPADLLHPGYDKELLWVFQAGATCRDAMAAPDSPERPEASLEAAHRGSGSPQHRYACRGPELDDRGCTPPGRRLPSPSPSPASHGPRVAADSRRMSPTRRPSCAGALEEDSPGRSRTPAHDVPTNRERTGSSAAAPPKESTFEYLDRVLMPHLQPVFVQVARERPANPIARLVELLQPAAARGQDPATEEAAASGEAVPPAGAGAAGLHSSRAQQP